MAVNIVVARLPADKKGADIVDPLLSNTTVAVIRGTAEIQDNEPIERVSISANYRINVKCGNIIEVLDELQGKVWRGKVVGIAHNSVLADIWTDLTVEKPKAELM